MSEDDDEDFDLGGSFDDLEVFGLDDDVDLDSGDDASPAAGGATADALGALFGGAAPPARDTSEEDGFLTGLMLSKNDATDRLRSNHSAVDGGGGGGGASSKTGEPSAEAGFAGLLAKLQELDATTTTATAGSQRDAPAGGLLSTSAGGAGAPDLAELLAKQRAEEAALEEARRELSEIQERQRKRQAEEEKPLSLRMGRMLRRITHCWAPHALRTANAIRSVSGAMSTGAWELAREELDKHDEACKAANSAANDDGGESDGGDGAADSPSSMRIDRPTRAAADAIAELRREPLAGPAVLLSITPNLSLPEAVAAALESLSSRRDVSPAETVLQLTATVGTAVAEISSRVLNTAASELGTPGTLSAPVDPEEAEVRARLVASLRGLVEEAAKLGSFGLELVHTAVSKSTRSIFSTEDTESLSRVAPPPPRVRRGTVVPSTSAVRESDSDDDDGGNSAADVKSPAASPDRSPKSAGASFSTSSSRASNSENEGDEPVAFGASKLGNSALRPYRGLDDPELLDEAEPIVVAATPIIDACVAVAAGRLPLASFFAFKLLLGLGESRAVVTGLAPHVMRAPREFPAHLVESALMAVAEAAVADELENPDRWAVAVVEFLVNTVDEGQASLDDAFQRLDDLDAFALGVGSPEAEVDATDERGFDPSRATTLPVLPPSLAWVDLAVDVLAYVVSCGGGAALVQGTRRQGFNGGGSWADAGSFVASAKLTAEAGDDAGDQQAISGGEVTGSNRPRPVLDAKAVGIDTAGSDPATFDGDDNDEFSTSFSNAIPGFEASENGGEAEFGGLDACLGVVHLLHRKCVFHQRRVAVSRKLGRSATSAADANAKPATSAQMARELTTVTRLVKLLNPLTLYKNAPPPPSPPPAPLVTTTSRPGSPRGLPPAAPSPTGHERLAAVLTEIDAAGVETDSEPDHHDAAGQYATSEEASPSPVRPDAPKTPHAVPLDIVAYHMAPRDVEALCRLVADALDLFAVEPATEIARIFGAGSTASASLLSELELNAAKSRTFTTAMDVVTRAMRGLDRLRSLTEEVSGVVYVISRLPNRSTFQPAVMRSGALRTMGRLFAEVMAVVDPWIVAARHTAGQDRRAAAVAVAATPSSAPSSRETSSARPSRGRPGSASRGSRTVRSLSNTGGGGSGSTLTGTGSASRAMLMGREKLGAWTAAMGLVSRMDRTLERLTHAHRAWFEATIADDAQFTQLVKAVSAAASAAGSRQAPDDRLGGSGGSAGQSGSGSRGLSNALGRSMSIFGPSADMPSMSPGSPRGAGGARSAATTEAQRQRRQQQQQEAETRNDVLRLAAHVLGLPPAALGVRASSKLSAVADNEDGADVHASYSSVAGRGPLSSESPVHGRRLGGTQRRGSADSSVADGDLLGRDAHDQHEPDDVAIRCVLAMLRFATAIAAVPGGSSAKSTGSRLAAWLMRLLKLASLGSASVKQSLVEGGACDAMLAVIDPTCQHVFTALSFRRPPTNNSGDESSAPPPISLDPTQSTVLFALGVDVDGEGQAQPLAGLELYLNACSMPIVAQTIVQNHLRRRLRAAKPGNDAAASAAVHQHLRRLLNTTPGCRSFPMSALASLRAPPTPTLAAVAAAAAGLEPHGETVRTIFDSKHLPSRIADLGASTMLNLEGTARLGASFGATHNTLHSAPSFNRTGRGTSSGSSTASSGGAGAAGGRAVLRDILHCPTQSLPSVCVKTALGLLAGTAKQQFSALNAEFAATAMPGHQDSHFDNHEGSGDFFGASGSPKSGHHGTLVSVSTFSLRASAAVSIISGLLLATSSSSLRLAATTALKEVVTSLYAAYTGANLCSQLATLAGIRPLLAAWTLGSEASAAPAAQASALRPVSSWRPVVPAPPSPAGPEGSSADGEERHQQQQLSQQDSFTSLVNQPAAALVGPTEVEPSPGPRPPRSPATSSLTSPRAVARRATPSAAGSPGSPRALSRAASSGHFSIEGEEDYWDIKAGRKPPPQPQQQQQQQQERSLDASTHTTTDTGGGRQSRDHGGDDNGPAPPQEVPERSATSLGLPGSIDAESVDDEEHEHGHDDDDDVQAHQQRREPPAAIAVPEIAHSGPATVQQPHQHSQQHSRPHVTIVSSPTVFGASLGGPFATSPTIDPARSTTRSHAVAPPESLLAACLDADALEIVAHGLLAALRAATPVAVHAAADQNGGSGGHPGGSVGGSMSLQRRGSLSAMPINQGSSQRGGAAQHRGGAAKEAVAATSAGALVALAAHTLTTLLRMPFATTRGVSMPPAGHYEASAACRLLLHPRGLTAAVARAYNGTDAAMTAARAAHTSLLRFAAANEAAKGSSLTAAPPSALRASHPSPGASLTEAPNAAGGGGGGEHTPGNADLTLTRRRSSVAFLGVLRQSVLSGSGRSQAARSAVPAQQRAASSSLACAGLLLALYCREAQELLGAIEPGSPLGGSGAAAVVTHDSSAEDADEAVSEAKGLVLSVVTSDAAMVALRAASSLGAPQPERRGSHSNSSGGKRPPDAALAQNRDARGGKRRGLRTTRSAVFGKVAGVSSGKQDAAALMQFDEQLRASAKQLLSQEETRLCFTQYMALLRARKAHQAVMRAVDKLEDDDRMTDSGSGGGSSDEHDDNSSTAAPSAAQKEAAPSPQPPPATVGFDPSALTGMATAIAASFEMVLHRQAVTRLLDEEHNDRREIRTDEGADFDQEIRRPYNASHRRAADASTRRECRDLASWETAARGVVVAEEREDIDSLYPPMVVMPPSAPTGDSAELMSWADEMGSRRMWLKDLTALSVECAAAAEPRERSRIVRYAEATHRLIALEGLEELHVRESLQHDEHGQWQRICSDHVAVLEARDRHLAEEQRAEHEDHDVTARGSAEAPSGPPQQHAVTVDHEATEALLREVNAKIAELRELQQLASMPASRAPSAVPAAPSVHSAVEATPTKRDDESAPTAAADDDGIMDEVAQIDGGNSDVPDASREDDDAAATAVVAGGPDSADEHLPAHAVPHEAAPSLPAAAPVVVEQYKWSAAELYAAGPVQPARDRPMSLFEDDVEAAQIASKYPTPSRTPRPPSAQPHRPVHHPPHAATASPSPPPQYGAGAVPSLRELYLMDHASPSSVPRPRPASATPRRPRQVLVDASSGHITHAADVLVYTHHDPSRTSPVQRGPDAPLIPSPPPGAGSHGASAQRQRPVSAASARYAPGNDDSVRLFGNAPQAVSSRREAVRTALPAFTLHRCLARDAVDADLADEQGATAAAAEQQGEEAAGGGTRLRVVEVLEWHSRPSIVQLSARILGLHQQTPERSSSAVGDGEHGIAADGVAPPPDALRFVAVDLSDHYVGDAAIFEGLGHALSTLRFTLVRLSMPRNGVSSRAVPTLLLDCLWHCEALEEVDLSGNKGITSSAGRTCIKFARHRSSLLRFELAGTYIFNATRAIIDGILQERAPPNPAKQAAVAEESQSDL